MERDLKGNLYLGLMVITYLLFSVRANAQIQNIKFNHLTDADGLSQNHAMSTYQDSRGFMWFGTYAGLNRYDASNFKVYLSDPKDTTTLTDNWIMEVLEDIYGNLWVSSLNMGLNKYNYKTDSFTRYQKNDDANTIPNDAVNDIFIDSNNQLWVGTSNGLARYNYDTDDFTSFFYDPENRGADVTSYEDHVYNIEEDDNNQLILATGVDDLLLFDKTTFKFSRLSYLSKNDKKQGLVEKVLLMDSTGVLWIGSVNNGLHSMNYKTKEVTSYSNPTNKPYINSLSIRSLLIDKNINLWIGSDGQGLYILNLQRDQVKNYRSDAFDKTTLGSNNGIYDMFEDRNGIIWLAQYNSGINYYDPNEKDFSTMRYNPTNPKSLSANVVFCFLEDTEGTIWVGTDGGGINIFDPVTREFKHYKHDPRDKNSLQSNIIKCIAEDKQGNLLIGTWNAGMMVFNKNTKKSVQYRHDPDNPNTISDDDVWDIEVDKTGKIWLGTLGGGLDRFIPEDGRFENYGPLADRKNKINHDDVRVMYQDANGIIWIGTLLNGVNRLDPETEEITYIVNDPDNPNSLAKNDVRAIFRDKDGLMWFGTEGGGLDRYDESAKKFINYSTKDGLPSDNIHGIMQDDDGILWISTGKGLAQFNVQAHDIRVYNKFDGLQGDDFQYGSNMKTKDGTMYFGGLNGFNVFHSGEVMDNEHIPNVVFTKLSVLYKEVTLNSDDDILKYPIEETKSIRLDYDQNVIAFEFATLNYTNSDKNMYAYKMEGFDKDWNYSGSSKNATYTNLDPGEYTFSVRGSNNDGVWNEKGATIQVIITPPFWATLWFRLLVLFAVIFMAYSWYKARIRKINRQKEKLEIQVAERTKELNERNRDLVVSKKQTDDILNNVKDGLFLLNSDFLIRSQYSKSLETIFDEKELGKKSLTEFLKDKIKKEELKNTKDYLELLFDDSVDYSAISELNPLSQIEFNYDQKNEGQVNKFLTFNFGRIQENDKTAHIIATVNDITDKVQLEKDLKESQEESKRKMEWLLKILNIEPAMLRDFISNAQEEIDSIEKVFRETDRTEWTMELLSDVGRYVHTIKGNAGLLDLDYLAQKAHQVEDEIADLKNRKKITRKNTKKLFILVQNVQEAFYEIKELIDQIGKLNDQLKNKNGQEKEMLSKFLGKLVNRLAKTHDKRVKLIMDNYKGEEIPAENRSLITDVLVQLVRNSMAHGIETRSVRKKIGKSESGMIEISNYVKGDTFIIKFKDDGQGIQLEKLREKAIESGKWTAEEVNKWDDKKLADVIFMPHLTTSDRVGMSSGRGMGMDIIKSKVEKMQGQIKIDSKKDKFCEFTIEFRKVA